MFSHSSGMQVGWVKLAFVIICVSGRGGVFYPLIRPMSVTYLQSFSGTRCSRRGQTSPPVPPPANTTKRDVVLDFGPLSPLCENMSSFTTRGTQRITLPSEERRATATGNMYRKLGEIWTCGC